MNKLENLMDLKTRPEPSLCDTCKYAYEVAGGSAAMGNYNCQQRYCSKLHIAIHFSGKQSCVEYTNKNIMKTIIEKDELHDTKEELNWWKNYAKTLEQGIIDIRNIINNSQGVIGYHKNGEIASWDELIENSIFDIVEGDMYEVNSNHEFTEIRDILYIKDYPTMPCIVQYTPVYGGVKFKREI